MSLKISTEPLEDRQLSMKIEVDKARVDTELKKAARKLAKDYRIPGFRRGKAPYHVIVQNLGIATLYNEFMDDLGQEVFKEAMDTSNVEPYALASLEDIQMDPLTYTVVVPLEPEVDLGDYRSIRIEEEKADIDDEAVEAELQSYQKKFAEWSDVDRPSEYGDRLNIDVRSVIAATDGENENGEEEDGEEEIVVLDETDWDVTPNEEHPMEPAGFDAELLGMRPGESKEFDLSWPADGQSIYKGKVAHFSVTLNSIEAYVEPPLDDELAQMVGPDFETLDELRERVREDLTKQSQERAREAYLNQALDAVLAQSTMVYPPVVIEDQIDSMVDDLRQQLMRVGINDLEAYLEQAGQEIETFREGQREQAKITAERNLVISELLRLEKIRVDDEEFEAKIDELVGEPGETQEEQDSAKSFAEMFRSGAARPMLEAQILRQKTLDRLLDIVRGEEVPDLSALAEEEEEAAAAESTVAEDAGADDAGSDDAEATDNDSATD